MAGPEKSAARTKKVISRFSLKQLDILRNAYQSNPYPNIPVIAKLASTVHLSRKQVQAWFVKERWRERHNKGIHVSISLKKQLQY